MHTMPMAAMMEPVMKGGMEVISNHWQKVRDSWAI